MAKFKVGDKVRFKDYTACGDYREHRGEIATIARDTGDNYLRWSVEWADGETSYVDEDNMTLATAMQGEKVMRKTYRQIKETPDSHKGNIWQEACDDGTQEYISITPEFIKGAETSICYPDRSLVEDQPKWFVEVFQVEPQFMTREELDQFEAFKKREKSPTAKRKYAKRNTRP